MLPGSRSKTVLLAAAVVGVTAAVASAAPQQTASASKAATHTISVRDDSFSKSKITVSKGDSVKWAWRNTDDDHNVTSGSKNPSSFKSKTEDGSFSFSHEFTKAGTYKIFCSIHPDLMKITVKVK